MMSPEKEQQYPNWFEDRYNLYLLAVDYGMFYNDFDRYNLYLSMALCKLLIGYLAGALMIPGYSQGI